VSIFPWPSPIHRWSPLSFSPRVFTVACIDHFYQPDTKVKVKRSEHEVLHLLFFLPAFRFTEAWEKPPVASRSPLTTRAGQGHQLVQVDGPLRLRDGDNWMDVCTIKSKRKLVEVGPLPHQRVESSRAQSSKLVVAVSMDGALHVSLKIRICVEHQSGLAIAYILSPTKEGWCAF
jgi:hypothetical protein